MAPNSTVFKVHLSVSNITLNYYHDHVLTIAKHPSETDLRLMVRILVFALNAHEHLKFGKGLSNPEEPDLWQIDLNGNISHWIDLGQPNEKRIRQACGKAGQVSIYTYQKGAAIPWYEDVKNDLKRFESLRVTHLLQLNEKNAVNFINRSMNLNVTIQDSQVTLSDNDTVLEVQQEIVKDFEDSYRK